MATFSTNQARQIYVAKQVADPIKDKGDIKLVAPEDADYIYFQYVGADTPLRSDLIKKNLISKVTLTHGKNIQKYLNQYDVSLDSKASATPIAGQEYLLRINMLGYASLGIENTYQKYGYVRATANMSASDFYKKMAQSLARNFAREPWPVYKFFVSTVKPGVKDVFPDSGDTGVTVTEVTATTDLDTLSGTYQKLVIQEVSGLWRRGTDEDMPQLAQIFTDHISVGNGIEQPWGEVKQITTIANLTARKDSVYRQLADLEYFLMGERADKYRLVGWPKVIYTDYMIDSIGLNPSEFQGTSDTTGVGIIDIHYSYVGSNESVQKSEKDICIILPNDATKGAMKLAQAIADTGITVVRKNAAGEESVIPQTKSENTEP